MVTFTLTVIDEPHCDVNVTLNGPRKVFFDEMEKFEPVETVCEAGETIRLEGYEATTSLAALMLTITLPVEPLFFLTEILAELTWMVQSGGPLSPPTPPPERSIQGVLSVIVVPPTTARALIPSDEVKVLL